MLSSAEKIVSMICDTRWRKAMWRVLRTFDEFSTVDLAGGDFDGDNVTLQLIILAVAHNGDK